MQPLSLLSYQNLSKYVKIHQDNYFGNILLVKNINYCQKGKKNHQIQKFTGLEKKLVRKLWEI